MTPFVARFIGGHNVLSGRVVAVDGGAADLVDEVGRRFRVGGSALAEGQEIAFAVRADHLQLAQVAAMRMAVGDDVGGGADAVNGIDGTVTSVQYQGTCVEVRMAAPGLETLMVSVPEGRFYAAPVEVGMPARLSFAVGEAHVLHS
jgi:putative spermidine/putrescine transport system ATP-binding protein